MTEKRELNKPVKISEPGMLKNISNQIRLILRLLRDRRVSFLAKLLPIGALIYLLSPDFFPFILDDAGILGVGLYLFLDFCPADVVEEHRQALWGEEALGQDKNEDEILDAKFKEQEQN